MANARRGHKYHTKRMSPTFGRQATIITTKTSKMMALKRRVSFNLDKLRLCYKQPQQLFYDVTSFENGSEIDCGDFRLRVLDNGRTADNELPPTNATVQIVFWDGSKDVALVDLELNNSPKYAGKCFLSLNQPALYDQPASIIRLPRPRCLHRRKIQPFVLFAVYNRHARPPTKQHHIA